MSQYNVNQEMVSDLKNDLLDEAEEQLEKNRRFQQRLKNKNRAIRDQVIKELGALKAIEERSQRIRDPKVRALVQELVAEANERGMTISDLHFGLSGRQSVRDRLGGLLNNNANNNNLVYLGLVLLALMAIPSVREALRPLLGKVVDEIDSLGDKVKGLAVKTKEGIEDIVAEAQFERLQEALNAEIEDVDKPETTNE